MAENASAAGRQPAAQATQIGLSDARKYSTGTLQAQRERYTALGLDVLPLEPGGKECTVKGWQKRAPAELWRRASAEANLGIRAGGSLGVAVVDADDKNKPGTAAAVLAFLAGLGLADKTPQVVTPSGGAHVYLRLTDAPAGSVRHLRAGDLAGELRYGSGSYVGAPPSVLMDGRGYRLVAGDFASIPAVTWSDLLPLLGTVTTTEDGPHLAPITGATADKLLSAALTLATTGTRHNTGFWLARMLRNNGAPMSQAAAVMREYAETVTQAGHPYTEAEALATLRSTYRRTGHANYGGAQALDELAAAYLWAESTTFPGRTGRTDRAVFMAHLHTGWQAVSTVWSVGVRTLAEQNGIGKSTAADATNRLVDAGILCRMEAADKTEATSYALAAQEAAPFQNRTLTQLEPSEARTTTHRSNSKPADGSGRVLDAGAAAMSTAAAPASTHTSPNCFGVRLRDLARGHDVWRFKALGKSAADVYDALATGPGTVAELASRTGMSKPTAWRALRTLAAHGLAESDGRLWHHLDADLDALAASLGTAGEGKRQAARHEEERQSWRELCRLRLHKAERKPMAEAQLVNPARLLAGRQTAAERRRAGQTEHIAPERLQDAGTTTSTPPPVATASPQESTTQTPAPLALDGVVHELAAGMRYAAWPQRRETVLDERRHMLQAQAAECERSQAVAPELTPAAYTPKPPEWYDARRRMLMEQAAAYVT